MSTLTPPPDTPTPRTLADQCFDFAYADDSVFCEVNQILGCNIEDCSREGFKWQCTDSSTDYYDRSVEVVRPPECVFMNREQADRILALGFSCIYESIGDKAQEWTKSNVWPCSPRSGNRTPLVVAKQQLAAVTAERDRLKLSLAETRDELVFWNTEPNQHTHDVLKRATAALNPKQEEKKP